MAQRLAGHLRLPLPHGRHPRARVARPALRDRHGRLRFDWLSRGRRTLSAPRPHDGGVVARPDDWRVVRIWVYGAGDGGRSVAIREAAEAADPARRPDL